MSGLHQRAWVVCVTLGLAGCGEPELGPTFDTEGWIDTSPPSTPSDRPGGGGGEDEDEDDDDEDSDETGAFWAIYGDFADGQWGEEVIGEYFAIEAGREVCLIEFEVSVRGPVEGCSDCSAAWELEAGEAFEEINEGGACQSGPPPIPGLVFRLGMAEPETAMMDDGSGWRPIGEAFQEEGELVLEWEDGVEEFEPE